MSSPISENRKHLNNLAQPRRWQVNYIFTVRGPTHAPVWHSDVYVNNSCLGSGTGPTKPAAMESAAGIALRALGVLGVR
ncbi:hypothetical protein BDV98DRAFT_571198 [Pterulicium gracile]|uniref:DRBM domain-containing protein n=1 Tax=Pterulicium gracile TaxID=1884261 RepID=A0A5C3QHD3_9AGAR|nr:hypothetical protein BDV98DRAFT_571198 [Pterula gracilis]